MLRRRLLLFMGSVVTLLVVAGVVTVLLLQDVLQDMDHAHEESLAVTTTSASLRGRLIELEVAVGAPDSDWARLNTKIEESQSNLGQLAQLEIAQFEAADVIKYLDANQNRLQSLVRDMQIPDSTDQESLRNELRQVNLSMRDNLVHLDQTVRDHFERQQKTTTSKFRWVALGLGLAFLVIINISVMVFSRLSGTILQPIDQLLDASRRLANEEYGYRVQVKRHDEFEELAQSYNNLAAQLQANEERKIETLHQVARTLNHELNNAIAIIQLQLRLLARSADADGLQAERWQEIHRTLTRMSDIVKDLTKVRRIVLTDYLAGVKMLDLKRSVDPDPIIPSCETV